MALLPVMDPNPTLTRLDEILVEEEGKAPERPYLGMSSMGTQCDRRPWYSFHWVNRENYTADQIRRFADGHRSELGMADYLRKVPGVELRTVDAATGRQIEFLDHGGHFRGHVDGIISGILEAPKTPHVWEHKAVNDDKFKGLKKLVERVGEKESLKEWDQVYYAQAVLYCYYADTKRHFLTVSTPGLREVMSVRTEANKTYAKSLIERAKGIIFAATPPGRVSEKPDFYQCRMCPHRTVCHQKTLEVPLKMNCRTCLHSTAREDGSWFCEEFQRPLGLGVQYLGCLRHLYNPKLVPGSQEDATDDAVVYQIGGKRVTNRLGGRFI